MNIIIDTCYWIALFNPDKHAHLSDDIAFIEEYIENENILIPFPSLYEFLNSKFSRKCDANNFKQLLSRPNYLKIDDNHYKLNALENFFNKSIYEKNDVSLVDEIIKEIIDTKTYKIDYLISFDEGLNNYALSKGIQIYTPK